MEPQRTIAERIVDRFRHHEDREILILEIAHAIEDARNEGHAVLVQQISIPCDDEESRKMAGERGPTCPRCLVNPLGPKPIFLGPEGSVCGDCWTRDRYAEDGTEFAGWS